LKKLKKFHQAFFLFFGGDKISWRFLPCGGFFADMTHDQDLQFCNSVMAFSAACVSRGFSKLASKKQSLTG
jgi:hypothetical protein